MRYLWKRKALWSVLILLVMLCAACSNIPDQRTGTTSTSPGNTPGASSPSASGGRTILSQVVPARSGASVAYDARHNQVVLFGGDATNDTWTWNGQSWAQLFPASVPPVRSGASMAYDAATGQIILFGGTGVTGTALGDTWAWNGGNWIPLSPSVSPPARAQASMVYDTQHQQIVLFGGMVMGGQHTSPSANDTWVWNGTNWQQEHPKTTPPARAQANMAYDKAHHQAVLFGGTNGVSVLNDTWAWNGSDWQSLRPATSPVARAGGSMAYDASSQQVVLFGGTGAADLNDTWVWNGSNWEQRPVRSSPKGSYIASAYDASNQAIVAYVVAIQNKTVGASQTWLWKGNDWIMSQ